MLLYHLDWLCYGTLLLMGLAAAWVMLAYYINAKRSVDDPEKKNYHPAAIVFAPLTFPILIILSVSFFLLRALSYGVFLILFFLALIFIPSSSVPLGLQKKRDSIGDRLLEINTVIIRFFLRPWANEPDNL